MSNNPNDPMTEGEVALLSAVECLADVLMAIGVPGDEIARRLKTQEDMCRERGLQTSAAMLRGIRAFVNDPTHEQQRQREQTALRAMLDLKPQGRA